MADTGATSPGTMANDNAVGTVAWNNPNNAKASNNAYANSNSMGSGSTTNYLKATNFGFAISSGATIDGIIIEIERHSSKAAIRDYMVKIVKSDGSIGETNKAITGTSWAITDPNSYVSYGANNDLWGEGWTAADINDVDFGVVLSASRWEGLAVYAYVDHIRITVYYTAGEPPAGTNLQVQVGDVFRPVSEIHVNVGDVWRPATAFVNVGDVWRA